MLLFMASFVKGSEREERFVVSACIPVMSFIFGGCFLFFPVPACCRIVLGICLKSWKVKSESKRWKLCVCIWGEGGCGINLDCVEDNERTNKKIKDLTVGWKTFGRSAFLCQDGSVASDK